MSESKRYIDLAGLLNKRRDRKKALQVEEILESSLSIHDKIDKIKEIDSSVEYNMFSEQAMEFFSPESVAEKTVDTHDEENYITAQKAEKNRDSIKIHIKSNDFFSFLFSDFRKIISFAHKSGRKEDLIRYSYFPPKIRINRRIQSVFEQSTIKYANELKPVLKKVLSIGWMNLDKFEYNLIVVFDSLCNIVVGLNFRRFDLNNIDIVDHIIVIENLFLSCRAEPIYPVLISSSISHVIEKHPEWMLDRSRFAMLAHKILDQKPVRPSLYNIILMLNMVKYKRYLVLEDIIKRNRLEIAGNFDFDADHEVRKKINAYIEKKVNDLEHNISRKNDFEKISRFLELNEKGELNYSFIEKQYGSFGSPARLLSEDRDYPAEFIHYFSRMFVKHFEEILSGQIDVESAKKVRIFDPDFFQYELSKIRLEYEKLTKYNYLFRKIQRERYLAILSTRKTGTQSEMELLHILTEIQSQLKIVSEKLIDVIAGQINNSADNAADQEMDKMPSPGKNKNVPLAPGDCSGRNCVIPFSDEKIDGQLFISGLTVLKVLNNIAGLTLYFKGIMGDSDFLSAISSSQGVYKDIAVLAEILKRVMSISEYKKIEKILI